MEEGKILATGERFSLAIDRLCYLLLETFGDFRDVCILGIQPRGVLLSDRILERLRHLEPRIAVTYGKLDITFYRDDFRIRSKPLRASSTEIDFQVDKKTVVLVDDVLYTGRTIQAAMAALQDFGRPERVELLVLVDRRFNRHMPIQPDFTGLTVDALDEAYVKVEWDEHGKNDRILLYPFKERD